MIFGNPHPVVVHFPVAFITVYCILELLRFNILTKQPYWFYLKAMTVFIGFAGALVAIITGLYITWGVSLDPVTRVHSYWGYYIAIFVGVIANVYKTEWILRDKGLQKIMSGKFAPLWNVMKSIHALVYRPTVLWLLALIGLISITVVGALGGILVRGPSTDPLAEFLYNLLIQR